MLREWKRYTTTEIESELGGVISTYLNMLPVNFSILFPIEIVLHAKPGKRVNGESLSVFAFIKCLLRP